MKKLIVLVLFTAFSNLNFASEKDSIYKEDNVVLQEGMATSEIEITPGGSENKEMMEEEERL